MTVIVVIWFACGALAGVVLGTDRHPQLDRLRCYAERQLTYWDGPTGTRPTPSTYRSVLHCWPKDGVFMNGDAALAWRVVKVKQQ